MNNDDWTRWIKVTCRTGLWSRVRMCPQKLPETPRRTPRESLELSQLQLFRNRLNLGHPWASPWGSQGLFSGHIRTLLSKPVLYITLIHLVKISKVVYFWRKVKKKCDPWAYFPPSLAIWPIWGRDGEEVVYSATTKIPNGLSKLNLPEITSSSHPSLAGTQSMQGWTSFKLYAGLRKNICFLPFIR